MRFARGDVRDHIDLHKNDHCTFVSALGSIGAVETSNISASFDIRLLQPYPLKNDFSR